MAEDRDGDEEETVRCLQLKFVFIFIQNAVLTHTINYNRYSHIHFIFLSMFVKSE